IRVGNARHRLESVRVQDYLTPVSTVAVDAPLTQLPPPAGQLIVGTGPMGQPLGVLDPGALGAVPREVWPTTPVSAVLQHLPAAWVVPGAPEDDMTDVVIALQTDQLPLVAVRDPDGRVHGVVRATDL